MDYLTFFLLCVIQEICLPVPEVSTILYGMSSIGPVFTFILGIIGLELGIIIMYFIVSAFKNKYLKKYESNKNYKKYQHYMSKNPFLTTGILFAIPVLPDEIIIVGSIFANIPLKILIILASISKTLSVGSIAFSEKIANIFSVSQWQVIVFTVLLMILLSLVYKKLND